jgi:hypothetical protein
LQQPCVNVKIENLTFNVCLDSTGLIISDGKREAKVDFTDFRNSRALREILAEEFGIDLKDPLNGRTAFLLQQNVDINKLAYSDIGVPNPSVCVHYSDEFADCLEEVVNREDGLVLQRYTFVNNNKQTIRTQKDSRYLLKGKIEKIRKVVLKGITLDKDLIKVVINGKTFVGTLDDTLAELKDFALDSTRKHYVAQFIFENAKITEEMFYSSGPWIVNNSIVFAEESGYLPPWKEQYRLKYPKQGDIKHGVELLYQLVNAYGDPSKVITVVSYGIIAWAKTFFIEKYGYFPHLVLYGPNNIGKSILIELLKIFYGVYDTPNYDFAPTSEYKLRMLLAKSTVPALIEEGNPTFSQVNNDKLFGTLVASSTTNFLTKSGSQEYGGLFLAVRSLIIPSNNDLTPFETYIRDKMIIIEFSTNDGIKLNNNIITPLRMTKKDKEDINALFGEVLRIFESRIGTLPSTTMDREGLVRFYINLGHEILEEIANKFFIFFPKPYIPSSEQANEDINDIVINAFIPFIENKKAEILGDENAEVVDPLDPKSALEKYNFFIDTRHNVVVFKIPLLTEYSVELMKRYGMQKLSWKRIAEILGIKRTRVARYGITLENVFEYKYGFSREEFCRSLDGKEVNDEELEYCKDFGYIDENNKIFKLYNNNNE